MKKSYKQKYEELLIKQHEKKFIHIFFSWKGIVRFFAFLGSTGLAIANFFLIISTWKMLKLGALDEENITSFYQLLILYPLIEEYIFIGVSIICLTAFIKGGFNKIKGIQAEGLIVGFVDGLIGGAILFLIDFLIFNLGEGLIYGLIVSFIVCLISSLIVGLTVGLIGEFE